MNCGAASSGRHGVFLPKIHVYLVLEAKNRMDKMEGSTYTVLLDLIIIILFEAEYHL
jgi:membrane glycosyltransferase